MSRLAWGLWLAGAALLLVAVAMRVSSEQAALGDTWPVAISQGVAFAAIGTVGLVLSTRRPTNPIGWLYLTVWVGDALHQLLLQYAAVAQTARPDAAMTTFAVWVGNWLWVPIVGILFVYPLLLFPDGRLPSPAWRRLAWASGIVIALWSVAFAFEGEDYTDGIGVPVENPYTPPGLVGLFDVARNVLAVIFFSLVICSVASLVVRFRRSGPRERAQIKWLILAGSAAAGFLALPYNHGTGNWVDVLGGFVFALLPISVGIAVLRYRLYEIDRIISRTASYALVTGVLLVVYAVVVTSVTRLLPHTSGSFGVAAATLAAAAAFRPVLVRVRAAVDRRFDRARYDAQQTVEGFANRLRDEVDADEISRDLLAVVTGSVQPDGLGLWLRGGRRDA